MDPALWELLRGGAARGDSDVEAIIRFDRPEVNVPGVRIVARFGPIATCRVRRGSIVRTRENENVLSIKGARLIGPEQHHTVKTAATSGGTRRPSAVGLTGAGVVIGVIDWGCDFDHPAFKHPADGSTRLRALWDQRGPRTAASPAPYGYGTVHRRRRIDAALADDEPYRALGYHPGDADPTGAGAHGTHVMDIAAGNGLGGGPIGIAPAADLVFVHLADAGTGGLATLGDSVRILEAVDFVAREAADRPWVINLSIGRHGGPHDGTTLVEQALDAVLRAAPGRFIVQSTGNYFAAGAHASGRVLPDRAGAVAFVTHEDDRTPNEFELWYGGEDVFTAVVESPTGHRTMVPLGARADIVEGPVVGRLYHRQRDPNNGDNHLDLFLDPAAPAGQWTVTLHPIFVRNGVFHAWLERDEACAHCQARFVATDIDAASTIGTIANGRLPLTVGAYSPCSAGNELAGFSSSGPTRDGRTKPDLLAPGVNIVAARSAPPGHRRSNGGVVGKSGTSMAAPHVTGCAALCLGVEALGAADLRDLLLRTAEPPATPTGRTGVGYLDIAHAVAEMSLGRNRTRRTSRFLLPSPRCPEARPEEAEMDPSLTNTAPHEPATMYRELVYRPTGMVASRIGTDFVVIALPGEAPTSAPTRGDLLVRVALGEPGAGHLAVLCDGTLSAAQLAALGGAAREGRGVYSVVSEDGAFPHCAADRFARRVLDAAGRMPAGQLLLRRRRNGFDEQAPDSLTAPLTDAEWQRLEDWQSAGLVGTDPLTGDDSRNASLVAGAIFCSRKLPTGRDNDDPLLCIDPTVTAADPRVAALSRQVVAHGPIINWTSVPPPQRRIRVMELLIDQYGYPTEGAAGLVGNLDAESAVLPNRIEGSAVATPMRAPNFSGATTDFTAAEVLGRDRSTRQGPRRAGIGLAQWTSASRRAGLFAHRHGTTPAGARILFDLPAQVDYLVNELRTNYAAVERTLAAPGVTADDASDDVVYRFEVPASILLNGTRRARSDAAVQRVFRRRRAHAAAALADYEAAHPAPAPTGGEVTSEDEAPSDIGRDLLRRFPTGVHVALYDPGTSEFTRRATAWATREEAVGAPGNTITATNLTIGSPLSDVPGVVRILTDLTRVLVALTGDTTGPALIRTLALFAHGWDTTLAIGNGLTAHNVHDVVRRLAPMLTDDVTIVLYGCSVCAQAGEGGWVATTMHGGGPNSLCAKVRDALVDQGKANATVWGHTEVGHATTNWSLRCFRAANGRGAAGEAFAGDIVFGAERPRIISQLESAIGALAHRVAAARRTEFERFVRGRLEPHLYKAYGHANRTMTHGGANLAERAPLYPDEIADLIRDHWRNTYWVDRRTKPFTADVITRLRRLGILERAPTHRPAPARAPDTTEQAAGATDWCALRQRIVNVARTEEQRWTAPGGKLLENDPSMLPVLRSYWATVPGFSLPANALAAAHQSAANHPGWPWSAAFICFVMHTAGVRPTDGFEFSRRHLNFIVGALRNRERSDRDRAFWLVDHVEMEHEATPQPGDLLCWNRCCRRNGAPAVPPCSAGTVMTQHTYNSLRTSYWDPPSQAARPTGCSHTAIVVGTVTRGATTFIETIGGNESGSVRADSTIPLNADGGITNPQARRLFGLIKIVGC